MALKLSDIQAVLGCDKSTASRLARGCYERPNSDLPGRYAALVAVVDAVRRQSLDPEAICMACPREDCTGCRLAEM